MIIYKNYDLTDGVLTKQLKKDHLMKMFGFTPGIDKDNVWDKYQDQIRVIDFTYSGSDFEGVKHGTHFQCTKADFQDYSFKKNFGFGDQMFMDKKHWLMI